VSLSLPRAVIIDWDNTLVDSWGAIADAMNTVRAHFGQLPWSLAEVMTQCTRSARDSFPTWYGDRWQEASDVFYKRFSDVQMANLKPLHGAADLLGWLKDHGIPIFVVSNKNGEFLRREVTALGWEHYFASIVGATDAGRDKPAREAVDYALKDSGIGADMSLWFVGDSETDILCARNAGCTPVLIGAAETAEKLSVDLVFTDCKALQTRLSTLANTKRAPF
jgi:phosphoglycolate phosphatase